MTEPDATSGPKPSRREVQQALRKAHRHPWLRRGLTALAGGLAVLMVMTVMIYLKLDGNITQINVSGLLGKRPAKAGVGTALAPMNILVIGSDTRDLATGKFGSKKDLPGARPDTTLIVHLSGDRKSAVVVSIPRDSMTHAPRDCKDPNSPVADGPIRIWNSNQGAVCVQRAVEGNTGIFIDHSMVLDFDGFQKMVDALGTVEVCTPDPINDPRSGLVLKAGRTRVSGKDALAFVRARYTLGDGSDIGRIPRQQAFLSSMIQEATSTKLFLQPVRLLSFLDAVTSAVAVDPGLKQIGERLALAQSVVGMDASQIRFVTVPVEPYPPNHNRVQWAPDADALWKSIHDDAPLPGSEPPPRPKAGPSPAATTGPSLTVRPDRITVHVINASGESGRGRLAAGDLGIQGFHTTPTTTATSLKSGVIVGYSSRNLQSARTVAAAFPGAAMVMDQSAGDFIRVTLGAGSPDVVEVPNRLGTAPLSKLNGTGATPTPAVTIQARTADSNVCKA